MFVNKMLCCLVFALKSSGIGEVWVGRLLGQDDEYVVILSTFMYS